MTSTDQTILSLGAEMGSLTLLGTQTEGRWTFIIEVCDYSMELLDEGGDSVTQHTTHVGTIEEAFEFMDRYRWYLLYPLAVHADFRAEIWRAVKIRCTAPDEQERSLNNWMEACEIGS